MDESTAELAFLVCFAMAVAWLVQVWLLYRALEERHPEKFEEMGEPSLFTNNDFATTGALLGFLFSRAPDELGDPAITRQARIMRIWFVASALCLLLFMAALFTLEKR
jgi:hypothetical protein